jgi:pectinacetylesterase
MTMKQLLVLLISVAAACGDDGGAKTDGGPPPIDAAPDAPPALPIDPPPTPLTWTVYSTPGTQCIDGTPANFAINYNPDSTKLYIYLEGGGACFNGLCESLFTASANQPGTGGIFDRTNAANPVKDWSWIYVPYCSGDIYGGDKDAMVAGKLRHFHGYKNFGAFLARWVPFFNTVDQVLLSGSSAGGFGAAVNWSQTQRAFGTKPVALIDDSGPPLSSDVFPPCLQTEFRDSWGLETTILADCGADCTDNTNFVSAYLDHLRHAFPGMRAGLFSYTSDQTIRLFAGFGWSNGYNMCGDTPMSVAPATYTAGLQQLRTHVGAGFGSYFVAGTTHTILRSPAFYSNMTGGSTVPQWITGVMNGDAPQVGP